MALSLGVRAPSPVRRRSEVFESIGIGVVRFINAEVADDLDLVLKIIPAFCMEY